MTIMRAQHGTGGQSIKLVECPACGHEFGHAEHRKTHIAEHDPEDFGLTPLES